MFKLDGVHMQTGEKYVDPIARPRQMTDVSGS